MLEQQWGGCEGHPAGEKGTTELPPEARLAQASLPCLPLEPGLSPKAAGGRGAGHSRRGQNRVPGGWSQLRQQWGEMVKPPSPQPGGGWGLHLGGGLHTSEGLVIEPTFIYSSR